MLHILKPKSPSQNKLRPDFWRTRAEIFATSSVPVFLLLLLMVATVQATNSAPPRIAPTNEAFCAVPLGGKGQQGPGTIRMVARLQELLRRADPFESPYLNREAIPLLRAALLQETNAGKQFGLRAQLATQMMRAGHSVEALQEFNVLPGLSRELKLNIGAQNQWFLQMQRGLTLLRLGEQENCQLNHNADSCLFPIQGAGFHQLPAGSRGAVGAFTQMLKTRPNALGVRWLLNIAHMTLGEYPDKVAPELLIPPSAFASEYPLPRFPEAAAAAGLDVDDLAGGCITEDFDGDGLLDVMASSWSLHGQLRFFHNNGDGTFAERTREAGLLGLTGSLNITQTDFNNDGFMDVFMARGAWLGKAGRHPNSLLRNNGDGTFEDVTEAAGLLSFHPTQAVTWLDFDGDGWLDLFIGNESSEGDDHPCELYRNNGDGTFTECAVNSGVALVGFVKGVTSGDYDNDGRPDLYISCRGQYNTLLRNEGPSANFSPKNPTWKFSDATKKAGVAEPVSSFPTWFFDYDNDGRLDLFVSGYSATIDEIAADYLGLPHRAERARLYHNKGDGTFEDVTKAAGLYRVLHTMGSNFGDFDNDGWLDMYLGTGDPDFSTLVPNRAFRNNGGKNFQDVTTAAGLGHLQKGHAIAFADLDNDGNQDIYAVMGGAYTGDNYRNALFVNPGNSNGWLTLKIEGVKSNRAAIGARVRVILDTPGGERSLYKNVCNGGSFGSSPLRQEFGLGDARAVKAVEIFWPVTGLTQKITGLEKNRFYRVREGADHAEPLTLKQFQLAKVNPPMKHSMHQEHPKTDLVPGP